MRESRPRSSWAQCAPGRRVFSHDEKGIDDAPERCRSGGGPAGLAAAIAAKRRGAGMSCSWSGTTFSAEF